MSDIRLMSDYVDHVLLTDRFNARVVVAISVAVLFLAGLGIYGLAMHTVAMRLRELGIRMALGARPDHIGRLIMRRVALITCPGLVLGVGLFVALQRILRSVFVINAPESIAVPALAAVVVLVTAALGAATPIIRAIRLDPAAALRNEDGV